MWIVILFLVWRSDFGSSEFITDVSSSSGLFRIIRNHFPLLIFAMVSLIISVLAVIKRWSLIPVLGLLTNLYLMSQLGITNWFRFGIWLLIGLVLYFSYGSKHSRISGNTIGNNKIDLSGNFVAQTMQGPQSPNQIDRINSDYMSFRKQISQNS